MPSSLAWLPRLSAEWKAMEDGAFLLRTAAVETALGLALSPPLVQRWTGVSAREAWSLVAAHLGLLLVCWLVRARPVARAVSYALVPFVNLALVSALVVFTRTPATPWWAFSILYAVIAARAYGLVVSIAVAFFAAPLLVAACWHLGGAVPFSQSLGAALAMSVFAPVAYTFLGQVQEASRVMRERLLRYERVEAAGLERGRIARDLHDSVGSALTEVSLWLDVASLDAEEDAASPLGRARGRVREALDELRACVSVLESQEVPVARLEPLLQARLGGLCEVAEVRLSFETAASGTVLRGTSLHHLLHWTQEAVTNAVRHAGAQHIEVRVGTSPLNVEVSDDGAGFDWSGPDSGKLVSLSTRAAALGAVFEAARRPGGGTVMRLVAPPGAPT